MTKVQTKPMHKIVIMYTLFAATIIIMLLGISFSVFSLMNNVSFRVLNTSVHGAVFGVLVVYLGAKYFLSVNKFKTEFFKSTSQFSWDNFKYLRKKNRKSKCY